MSATSSSPMRCAAPRPASAAQIVAEKEFKDTGTARRTDSGVVQIQRQMPVFTQDLPDHDVVLVADESEVFGTYVPFRTWIPRPVAGTAGLMPSAWHPASEQWGGTQIQNRFAKANGRRMLSKDMAAWTAARIIGDAATRTQGADPQKIEAFIRADDFSIAAFKGQKLTFRKWNWQLRQPIFLGDGRSVVSTSPQEGFLHQVSELDTLGVDQPETKCVLNEMTTGGDLDAKTTAISRRGDGGRAHWPARPRPTWSMSPTRRTTPSPSSIRRRWRWSRPSMSASGRAASPSRMTASSSISAPATTTRSR